MAVIPSVLRKSQPWPTLTGRHAAVKMDRLWRTGSGPRANCNNEDHDGIRGRHANQTMLDTLPKAKGSPNGYCRDAERHRSARQAVLLVSSDPDDKAALDGIVRQEQWMLFSVGTLHSALSVLRHRKIAVIIAERDLPQGGWKDLLAATQHASDGPLLVVVSRLADEYLWSEVLNLGGHDVLAKPFCGREVRHVLNHAWCMSQLRYSPRIAKPQ